MRGSDAIGKATEFKLASKLIELGHVPFWPMMDTGYDLGIVINKKFLKIQCKGTGRVKDINIAIVRNRGKQRRPYTTKDCDFIILYLSAYNTWYVIPVKKVRATSISISFRNKNRWNQYKNAWSLLGAP